MSEDLTGSVIIFDDDHKIIRDLYQKLSRAFPGTQILWSLTPDRKPRSGALPPAKNINDPSWNYPLTTEDLLESDVIVLDLQMEFADKSATDPDREYEKTWGGYKGFYVLDLAEKCGCLSKIFVNSAVIDLMRLNKPELAAKLEGLVENELIGVYRKEGDGTEFLLARIHSILDLKKRGYLCSPKTRNKLFLIGGAEAVSMEPVLIVGKTGTGKESAAWHIHEIGQRLRSASQEPLPLIVVHCGGLTPELARDELFGHARGAFTGATGFKLGCVLRSVGTRSGAARSENFSDWLLGANHDRLEMVAGSDGLSLRVTPSAPYGTIFLDEFGELDPSVQALLLRFLNDGEIQPLGYEGTISLKDSDGRLHVRFIGATNRLIAGGVLNIAEDFWQQQNAPAKDGTSTVTKPEVRRAENNSVREDLIYRIARWVIELPDLSPEEVEDLIRLEQARRSDLQDVIWEPAALNKIKELVKAGAFQGQRRELRTVSMRAMAYAKGAAALGMSIYIKEAPAVTLDILREATQPVTLESSSTNQVSKLHNAICELLRSESVWSECPVGFTWEDLHGINRVELCRLFLRSLLFRETDRGPYQLHELEIAWGIEPSKAKLNTARNSVKPYITKALQKELGHEYSEKVFPPKSSYTKIRAELIRLMGEINI